MNWLLFQNLIWVVASEPVVKYYTLLNWYLKIIYFKPNAPCIIGSQKKYLCDNEIPKYYWKIILWILDLLSKIKPTGKYKRPELILENYVFWNTRLKIIPDQFRPRKLFPHTWSPLEELCTSYPVFKIMAIETLLLNWSSSLQKLCRC